MGNPLPHISREEMRRKHQMAISLEQPVPDLAVAKALVDHFTNLPAGLVGGGAAVGVAACEAVEVPGADVPANLAGAVDAGQEPLDPFVFGPGTADVGG